MRTSIILFKRRYCNKKLYWLIFFIVFYLLAKIFRRVGRLPFESTNDKIIVVNLKAFNETLPNFLAESQINQNDNFRLRLPNELLNEPAADPPKANRDYEDANRNGGAFPNGNARSSGNATASPPVNENDANAYPIDETDSWHKEQHEMDTKFEELIKADEEKIIPGLGNDGVPVTNPSYVTKEEIKKIMKKEAFNKILSDLIPFTRKVPDARHSMCASVNYSNELPSTSIVIIFVNEAWSTLMRTVHSTLIRSPEEHLKEIILVDDASDREELKGKLDYYIKTRLPKNVKLIRLPERNGLIKARMAGAKIATGDVLVFLDSHCECVVGWLEPLLQRIKEKRNAVVCPIIDVISDEDFAYLFSSDRQFQIGGFTWPGHFTWIPIPDFEEKRRVSPISPTRSPTMAGGLFAIHREYFWEIGAYDQDMEVWGGENLEISFRIWQCGGSLEIVPCSRVGHIFRSFHPYTFPGHKDTHGINTARMAEVWMDDYKRLFYLHRPDLKLATIGDVSSRVQLREQLGCQDFKWYLKNIIPQKFVLDEDVLAYGRIRSKSRFICFDNLNKPEDSPHDIGVYNCHDSLYSSQYFSLSNKGELRREELCAEVTLRFINIPGLMGGAKGNVTLVQCNGNKRQVWTYENNMLRNTETGYCIHSYGLRPETLLSVAICKDDIHFKWLWEFIKINGTEYMSKNYAF